MTNWFKRIGGLLAVVALAGLLVACTEAADDDTDSPGREPPPATGTPIGDIDYPTKQEPAPIEEAEVLVRESFPVQYGLHIVSGLPSGCAEFHSAEVERNGTTFEVTVLNTMPDSDDVVCTMIYGLHETNLDLGSDLVSGTEYTVDINDGAKVLTFTAQ